jgi:hypothetical protein
MNDVNIVPQRTGTVLKDVINRYFYLLCVVL